MEAAQTMADFRMGGGLENAGEFWRTGADVVSGQCGDMVMMEHMERRSIG